MTGVSQTRVLLRSAAVSAAIFLMAVPAALADPAGSASMDLAATTQATVSTLPPPSNAPKPGASFLSDDHAFDELDNSSRSAPAFGLHSDQAPGEITPVQ